MGSCSFINLLVSSMPYSLLYFCVSANQFCCIDCHLSSDVLCPTISASGRYRYWLICQYTTKPISVLHSMHLVHVSTSPLCHHSMASIAKGSLLIWSFYSLVEDSRFSSCKNCNQCVSRGGSNTKMSHCLVLAHWLLPVEVSSDARSASASCTHWGIHLCPIQRDASRLGDLGWIHLIVWDNAANMANAAWLKFLF